MGTALAANSAWVDPVVGIEGRSLAGRVLGAAVLAAIVAPAAALLPLFDPGEKQQGDPCGEPNGAR